MNFHVLFVQFFIHVFSRFFCLLSKCFSGENKHKHTPCRYGLHVFVLTFVHAGVNITHLFKRANNGAI